MTTTVDDSIRRQLVPGAKVKVTQQIAARHYSLTKEVVGDVVSYEQKQTGSWYAHSKNDKLWLDRLVLKKADGGRALIPFVSAIVPAVDLAGGRVVVDLPEGLLDL